MHAVRGVQRGTLTGAIVVAIAGDECDSDRDLDGSADGDTDHSAIEPTLGGSELGAHDAAGCGSERAAVVTSLVTSVGSAQPVAVELTVGAGNPNDDRSALDSSNRPALGAALSTALDSSDSTALHAGDSSTNCASHRSANVVLCSASSALPFG